MSYRKNYPEMISQVSEMLFLMIFDNFLVAIFNQAKKEHVQLHFVLRYIFIILEMYIYYITYIIYKIYCTPLDQSDCMYFCVLVIGKILRSLFSCHFASPHKLL